VIDIHVVDVVDDELLGEINHLLPQLSSSARSLTIEHVRAMVESDAITLFAARHQGKMIGMLTLVIFPIPTGIRAWIEDVVVDNDARGLGAGSLLTTTALEYAKQWGAVTVDLTSRPSREAANALYRRVGFAQRETNVYRFLVEP
jgi:ribosomal protein S18 acetylase RimI-like enzyme